MNKSTAVLGEFLLWGLLVTGSAFTPPPGPAAAPAAVTGAASPADPGAPPAVQEAVLDWQQGVQVDPDLSITLGTDPRMPFGVF